LEIFKQASRLLRAAKAEVICGDFEKTCSEIFNEPSAFIYLDPPYLIQAEKLYEHSTNNDMFSHERLASYLSALPKHISYLLS